jgi:LPS-assembly protein
MRGDAYQIYDRDLNSNVGGTGGENAFRFYPVLHDVVSYPVAKNIGNAQIIIEPTVSFTMSSKTKNDTKIPNEDSQDAQIDTTNIFEANRFPGLDRVEDKSHITYGTRAGVYADDGSLGEFFLGQSYRFDNDSNPFPSGSGLSEQESDVVGQVTLNYQNLYDLNYRFQLGSDNFQSERHELDASADFGRLSLSTTYLYARKLERTDIQDSRQQIYGSSAYELDENWNVSSYVRYDLSKEEEGLRSTGLGLNYIGQCFNILTSLRRTYADKETGDNATEFSVQLGLKNIGSFGTDQ